MYFWFLLEDSLDSTNELGTALTTTPEMLTLSHQVFKRLLGILYIQVRFPSDTELKSWDAGKFCFDEDSKDRFRNHRNECGDAVLQCYYNLQSDGIGL